MKKQPEIHELSIIEDIVQTKIYIIKGQKVMLDIDLALLYKVNTKALNQAVKRNIQRFPTDFMFSLSQSDEHILRSQIVTAKYNGLANKGDLVDLRSQFVIAKSRKQRNKRRSPILVFTEQGIAMLSSVLRSDRAIQVNIQIMRTFTKLRQMLATHTELKEKIEALENKYDGQFKIIFDAINRLIDEDEEPKNPIGFQA